MLTGETHVYIYVYLDFLLEMGPQFIILALILTAGWNCCGAVLHSRACKTLRQFVPNRAEAVPVRAARDAAQI
jgi:hypothetical protein